MYSIITQAIGFLGTGLLAASYQCKSPRKLFFVQLCSNLSYIIHFLMLGAYSGCVNITLSFIRNCLLCSRKSWARWKGWPVLFVVAHVVATVLTWQNFFSILPCAGMIAMVLSSFTRNGKKVRLANIFVNSPAWLIYDIYTHSYSGIVCEMFCLVSTVISVIRFGWKALDAVEN